MKNVYLGLVVLNNEEIVVPLSTILAESREAANIELIKKIPGEYDSNKIKVYLKDFEDTPKYCYSTGVTTGTTYISTPSYNTY